MEKVVPKEKIRHNICKKDRDNVGNGELLIQDHRKRKPGLMDAITVGVHQYPRPCHAWLAPTHEVMEIGQQLRMIGDMLQPPVSA